MRCVWQCAEIAGIGASLSTPLDSVRTLQSTLRAKAKREAAAKFYSLWDKVGREDVLYEAYRRCRANRGAPGVDGESFKDIEADGLASWLQRLKQELRTKQYRCAPLLRVWIPKANGGTAGARTDLRSRPVPLAVRLARGHGRQDGTSAHSLRGIFAERTPTFDLQTRPYRRVRLVLVVPARHALAARRPATVSGLANLLDFDFVSLPQQTSLAQRLRAESTSIGRRLRVRIQRCAASIRCAR